MSTERHKRADSTSRKRQQGFALLEVLISIVVLTIGMVSLLSLFAVAIASTQDANEDMLARQEAVEALESIYTARNTSQITFAQIQNTPNGVFLPGLQPNNDAGPDGLDGTADDLNGNTANPYCPGPAKCVELPGTDGILGTSDDQWLPLNNYQRSITITPLNPNLSQITVTVQYTTSQFKEMTKTYSVGGLISSYR